MRVARRLDVEGQDAGTGGNVVVDLAERLRHHQMHVLDNACG